MSNLLQNISAYDELIRDLQKIESKLLNGQEILAYRDVCRVISKLQKGKEHLVESSDVDSPDEE